MLRMLWIFTLIALVAGCDQPSSSVVSIDPVNGSMVPAQRSTITVVFDRAMDEASINTASFLVDGSLSGRVSGLVTYSSTTLTATFLATNGFMEGETVTVTLTDDVQSASRKDLRPFTSTFRIEGQPVVEPDSFLIDSVTPTREATAVPRITSVDVQFTSPYNPFTVTAQTVRVEGERSGMRIVSFDNVFGGFDTVTILSDRPFLAGERISVAVTDVLSSLEGVNPPTSLFQFTARNLGADWPTVAEAADTSAGPGLVRFLDADQDDSDEWAVVLSDGTITTHDSEDPTYSAIDNYNLAGGVADAAVGDFDGDGRPDLVCLATNGASLFLLYGSASSGITLDAPVTIPVTGFAAAGLTAGHFDEDGIPDLFLRGADPTDGGRILWGEASSPLSSATTLNTMTPVADVICTDLDGNDLPDIAFVNGAGNLGIFWGTETRTFSQGTPLAATNPAIALVTGNFDNDNLADLLAIADAGFASTLFLNLGNDAFASSVLGSDVANAATRIADWDGDRLLDLLTPQRGTAAVDIHYGFGNGTFSAPAPFVTSEIVNELELGDINGDGALDVGLFFETRGWEVGLGSPTSPLTPNALRIPSIQGAPGDSGVSFQIDADNDVGIEGYTVVIGFDETVLTVDTVSTLGTDAGAIGVEFEIPQIDNALGVVIVAAILDFLPPFDGQTIPPGTDTSLVQGTLSIDAAAASGTVGFSLQNGLGSPPNDNSFVVAGLSLFPNLEGGGVVVTGGTPPSGSDFVRGDFDGDGILNLADATALSDFLFAAGPPPVCIDAADANDDGVVDISDPLYLNDFLFSGGSPPPPPYPGAGSDPTADALVCSS